MDTPSLEQLISMGERLGYAGSELQKFVKDEQKRVAKEMAAELERQVTLKREEAALRAAEREKEVERAEREAALRAAEQEKEVALERERAEREAALERERVERQAQVERERGEQEAAIERERGERAREEADRQHERELEILRARSQLPDLTIDKVFAASKQFFNLDRDTKVKYNKPVDPNVFHGYIESERECLNPERPVGDLKESYNVHFASASVWPEEVPDLKTALVEFNSLATELALRVLDTISLSFNKQDINVIRDCHKALGTPESPQCHLSIRTLYYPEVDNSGLKAGQLRCSEHSDYGSLTLLFQDEAGGLEVKTKDGDYIPATPIPGTVVVNLGDLMQMWTSDKLLATKHRVVVPDTQDIGKERQSLAVFYGTDLDTKLECLDGSNKYAPISAREYLMQQCHKTHSY